MDLDQTGTRVNFQQECATPFRNSGEHRPSPAAWASQERAHYTGLFQGLPKLKTIKGKSLSNDMTEDVLGIPIFVDRTIQICEDYLMGCLSPEIAAKAFERLVKSARSYSVPWNLVGHVLESAADAFPDDTAVVRLQSWAGKMNKLGSL